MNLPKARTSDLLEQEAGSELLIYDLRIDKAYNLNETLRNVFTSCGGKLSFDELKHRYKYTDDLIHLALQELNQNNLLEDYDGTNYFAGLSRREVIRKVGLATMFALPVIAALSAPKSIHAASRTNLAANSACTANGQCQNNNCCSNRFGNTICTDRRASGDLCSNACQCQSNNCDDIDGECL